MKLTIIILVGVIAVRLLIGAAAAFSRPHGASPDEMYVGLRNLALATKASDLGLQLKDHQQPYAVIMDIDVKGATATITSFATGDASLYVSTGGGTIGSGQASEEVANAAKQFVAASSAHVSAMSRATEQPLPGPGEVRFYVVSGEGIFTAQVPEEELGEGKNALSPLFFAGQNVLTQIRLLQERQDEGRKAREK
jgi:hypothetical protein